MCNLYRMTDTTAEVARVFNVADTFAGNAPAEIYPGYPGNVVAAGEVRSMVWGFPLSQTSKQTGAKLKPRPVNNARADKLDSFMWRYSFAERRCLIPASAFAEAEGPKGAKTRTWISLPDQPLFAIAGIWRETEEWGPSYTMVMTGACIHVEGIHDRMPVILRPEDWSRWTEATVQDAHRLCVPYAGKMTIARTSEPWVHRN